MSFYQLSIPGNSRLKKKKNTVKQKIVMLRDEIIKIQTK